MNHRDPNPQHPSNDEPLDPTEAMSLDPLLDLDEFTEQALDSLDAHGC